MPRLRRLDPATPGAGDPRGRRHHRFGRGLLPDASARHHQRHHHGGAYQHVRAGPTLRHPPDGPARPERGAHARHDRLHVQPPQGALRVAFPRHRTGGGAHRALLVPQHHAHRLHRKAGLPLRRRCAQEDRPGDRRERVPDLGNAARLRSRAPGFARLHDHPGDVVAPRGRSGVPEHRGAARRRSGGGEHPPADAAPAPHRPAEGARDRGQAGRGAAHGQPRLRCHAAAPGRRRLADLRHRRAGPQVRRALQQQAPDGPAHAHRRHPGPGFPPGDDRSGRCTAGHALAPVQAVAAGRLGGAPDAGPGGRAVHAGAGGLGEHRSGPPGLRHLARRPGRLRHGLVPTPAAQRHPLVPARSAAADRGPDLGQSNRTGPGRIHRHPEERSLGCIRPRPGDGTGPTHAKARPDSCPDSPAGPAAGGARRSTQPRGLDGAIQGGRRSRMGTHAGRAADHPAGVPQLRRTRSDVGGGVPTIPLARGPHAHQPRQRVALGVRQGTTTAAPSLPRQGPHQHP